MTEERESALIAAAQGSEAVTELLRFAREGEHSDCFAFDVEVMEKLAEALKLSIDIERPRLPVAARTFGTTFAEPTAQASLDNLHTALVAFLEGWAG